MRLNDKTLMLGGAAVIGLFALSSRASASASAPSRSSPAASTLRIQAAAVAADVRARQYDYDRARVLTFQRTAGIAADGIYGPETATRIRSLGIDAPTPLFRGASSTSSRSAPTSSTSSRPLAASGSSSTRTAPAASRASPPAAEGSEDEDEDEDEDDPIPTPAQARAASPTTSAGPRLATSEAEIAKTAARRALALERGAASSSSSTAAASSTTNLDTARREAPALARHLKAKGKSGYSRQAVKDFQSHAGLKPDGIYGTQTAEALRYFGVATPPAPFVRGSATTYSPPAA